METSLAQLLLERLSRFIHFLSEFKYHLASGAILPDYQRPRSSTELSDPWIAVSSPLLLLAACERLYMRMDYLQGGLRKMLSNVVTDLIKVSDGLLHENEEACRRTDSNSEAQFSVGQTFPCDLEGPSVESALEAFRQLGYVAKVRLQMLDVYQEFFSSTSLSIDVDDMMTSSKETLNHPTIIPLANLISRELLVLKYALKVESLRQFGTSNKFESTISHLLDFRTAQAAWEGQPSGQFSLCRRMQATMRSFARTLPHEGGRSSSGTPSTREDQSSMKAGLSKRCTTQESSKGRIGVAGAGDIKHRVSLYKFPSQLAQIKLQGHDGTDQEKVSDGTDQEKVSDQQTLKAHAITHYPNGLEANTSGFVYSMRSCRSGI